jgi:hypothetical protein
MNGFKILKGSIIEEPIIWRIVFGYTDEIITIICNVVLVYGTQVSIEWKKI